MRNILIIGKFGENNPMLFFKISVFILLLFHSPYTYAQEALCKGIMYPDALGAKGDGIHDDTNAIQTALDSLNSNGGGVVILGHGTYLVKSLRLGIKTSLKGIGNGSTIIKQKNDINENCIVIPSSSAALKLSDFSIVGNKANCGLYIEKSAGGEENHRYLYSRMQTRELLQPYKWINIDNICIYHFETGLHIEPHGFNINISNSTFSHNGNGVVMRCTDSSLYNCYITNNRNDGLLLVGSNNKISNVKSIFNGIANPKQNGGIVVKGTRCQLSNCETQDNYGSGFVVEGQYNLFSNCISNTDGYSREPKQYDSTVKACGFMVKGLYNSFSNCVVTNYNEKYGAVYHSPVIVDKSVTYYYPDIFSDIKILIAKDRLLFREPYRNVQTLSPKNFIENLNTGVVKEGCYFISSKKEDNFIRNVNYYLNSLQILVDFRCNGGGGKLVEFDGDNNLLLQMNSSSISLLWQGGEKVELMLDKDVVLDKDDIRLIVAFTQQQNKLNVSMIVYEKTANRGWIKKEVRKETDIPIIMLQKASVKIGDVAIPVKRLAISQTPIPESVFLPSSNTNRIYDAAIVYIDADTYGI